MSQNIFYVIQIIASNEKVVVPLHWIKSVETQYPKYLNYGLNRTQKILIYYSPAAIDAIKQGESADGFQPNFTLGLQTLFPAYGCYQAKPCKCFGMYHARHHIS